MAGNQIMASTSNHSSPPPYGSVEAYLDNDFESDSQEEAGTTQQNAESALDNFIRAHPRPGAALAAVPRLRCPVVISQRRPGNKERGFVKAYAPDLEPFGIDQDSFIDFIRAINKASQASKWLVAIQVAAAGASFVPNYIALGVSTAVQIIAGVIAKAEIKWKTNSFMDRMNNEYFRPRGLYCLLMAYNPIAMNKKAKVNNADAVSKREPSSSGSNFSAKARRNFREPLAGIAQGEESLPDAVATLVYPERSGGSRSPGEQAKKRQAFSRLNGYLDRRAQARYAAESKGDVLSTPSQGPFKNRYLDPNHPASNGGILGLLSGGKLVRDPEKQKENMRSVIATQEQAIREQQSAQMTNLHQQLQGMGLTPEQQRDYVQQYESAYELQLQQIEQQSAMVEQGYRHINRNILYLMIVNMPTESEMNEARAQLNAHGDAQPTNDVTITTVNVE